MKKQHIPDRSSPNQQIDPEEWGESKMPPEFDLTARSRRRSDSAIDGLFDDDKDREFREMGKIPFTGFGGDIELEPGKTTTLLGRLKGGMGEIAAKHVHFEGKNPGGINLLRTGCWSLEANLKWLNEAISRRDSLRLVSDPSVRSNFVRHDKQGRKTMTIFGRELQEIQRMGSHSYDTSSHTFKA